MYKNFKNLFLTKLVDKKGEFDPNQNNDGGNQGGSNSTSDNNIIIDALSKMTQRMESIATSLATSKEDKTVNENLKQEIISAFKEEISGKAQEREDYVNTLKSDLEKANEIIKGYQLNEAIVNVANEIKLSSDGVDLFSQIIDKSKVFDKDGKIDTNAIKEQANAFVGKYTMFSTVPNSFGVNRTHYQGKGNQVQPDMSNVTLHDALASHYATQGLTK